MLMLKIAALYSFLLCQPVLAQIHGNDVYNACNAGDEMLAQQGFCAGYVSGAWQGMKYGAYAVTRQVTDSAEDADKMANHILNICVPDGVEMGQLVDVFVDYLASHPSTRHETARSLLKQSFNEAFPCDSS
jgi:hypothetical protein